METYYGEGITAIMSLFQIIILGACVYYFIYAKSVDGILLIIAALMNVLSIPVNHLMFQYFGDEQTSFHFYIQIYYLINIIIYAAGFVMLIMKVVSLIQKRDA